MSHSKKPGLLWRLASFAVRFLLPLVVLVAAVGAARYLIETGPTAQRRKPALRARLVEVVPADLAAAQTAVEAMGTVIPAREVVLKPRVSGEVVEVAPEFVPGGRFAKGDPMLRIDPTDYELVVRQREAALASVRTDLQIEEGNQIVARKEFELLGGELDEQERRLILREPQLEAIRAAVSTAEALLDAARLDLARTEIRSPFNALVRSRLVDLGMQVGPTTELVTLVATDSYWVEVTVPVDRLRWVRLPDGQAEPGATVRVSDETAWGKDRFRTGRVVRLLSDLEAEGRMARLIVDVPDPLALGDGGPSMLLGAYVRVRIDGRRIEDVVALDRAHLRDGDRVWVMDETGLLQIREVEIAFRERNRVYVSSGIRQGDLVVVSDLVGAVEGMPLRTASEDATEAGR